MRQGMSRLRSAYSTQVAYVAREILSGDRATLRRFLDSEPRLTNYRFYIEETIRGATHTLSEKEEKILASSGQVARGPGNAFSILSNADFPYPTVSLSDGTSAKLDQSTYSDLRALPNRSDRE